MVKISKLLPICLFSLSTAASVIPKEDIICSSTNPDDCYPLEFIPTKDWKPIKEGQHIPQGLEIRLDWQTGEKFAKLSDSIKDTNKEVAVKEIVESDNNKIVSYNTDEGLIEDDIQHLKMAASSSSTLIDLDDALRDIVTIVKSGRKDSKTLIDSLDSLTEHSHNLKDGVIITQEEYFPSLFILATSNQYSTEIRELSLRVIAQSLRHNPKALDNIDARPTFLKLFISLPSEKNSVLQKRILGVISSLLQTEKNCNEFHSLKGEKVLINVFEELKEDSKVRVLEILEDVKAKRLSKRSLEEEEKTDKILFDTIQLSLANDSIEHDQHLEILVDKLISLKAQNKSFKANNKFVSWLADHIEVRKLHKRDEEEDHLTKKLLEARYTVFGNPLGLRKALGDEF